jgi:hypothetical protein
LVAVGDYLYLVPRQAPPSGLVKKLSAGCPTSGAFFDERIK